MCVYWSQSKPYLPPRDYLLEGVVFSVSTAAVLMRVLNANPPASSMQISCPQEKRITGTSRSRTSQRSSCRRSCYRSGGPSCVNCPVSLASGSPHWCCLADTVLRFAVNVRFGERVIVIFLRRWGLAAAVPRSGSKCCPGRSFWLALPVLPPFRVLFVPDGMPRNTFLFLRPPLPDNPLPVSHPASKLYAVIFFV